MNLQSDEKRARIMASSFIGAKRYLGNEMILAKRFPAGIQSQEDLDSFAKRVFELGFLYGRNNRQEEMRDVLEEFGRFGLNEIGSWMRQQPQSSPSA